MGFAGPGYGLVAGLSSAAFIALALTGLTARGEAPRWARTVFLATLVYLTTLMVALIAGAGR
jgi:protoheme IX farnesyltransferase